MATTSAAAVRRGHSFDGGGGRSSQGIDRFTGGGGVIERKVSDYNWNMTREGAEEDDDEDEKPLCIVGSARKLDGSGSGSAPTMMPWRGKSSGTGHKGEGVASGRKETGLGGAEKKRGLGEAARVNDTDGGCGTPITKKIKVSPEVITDGQKKPPASDDDAQDDLPLVTRKPVPPSMTKGPTVATDTLTSSLALARKAWDEKKKSKTKEGLAGVANLTSNGASLPSKASTPRSTSKEVIGGVLNISSVVKDEKPVERKIAMNPSVKVETGNSANMAFLTSNGAATPLKPGMLRPVKLEGQNMTPRPVKPEGQSMTPRPIAKDVHGRIPNNSEIAKDEKLLKNRAVLKPVGRTLASNVVDSDDSDDDKPLSHRKSLNVPSLKETKVVGTKELKESGLKRSAGQSVSDSTPPAVKKVKMLSGLQQTQRPSSGPLQTSKPGSVQSPKPGSILSPKSGTIRDSNSTPRSSGGGRVDLDDDDDDLPLAQRKTSFASGLKSITVMKKSCAPIEQERDLDDDEDDYVPLANRKALTTVPKSKVVTTVKKPLASSAKSITKKVLEQRRKGKNTLKVTKEVFKKVGKNDSKMIVSGGTRKWDTLEHNGVIFPPPYVPHGIKMLYKGKPVTLTPEQEEVATMFAVMKDTDYATKPKFIENFWGDWQQILGDKHVIQDFERCDFSPIYNWHIAEKEKKKTMTAEDKKKLREEKLKVEDKYMWALVNGVKEKVGNFRVEPPGLFRGRGEHPKMGKLKKRIFPENIVINIGKGAPIPECPMPGHKWKEIRYDNTVTWLAYWNDPINIKEFKYVFLAASSSLKGQSDMEKYEKARLLKDHIDNIRKTYTKNFSSPDAATRQVAVATYLIDRLALRAGNEKDEDEADTVGCCSLKFEHVILVPPKSLTFDFLGKDSIRYFNTVEVEEKVYKAIGDFKKGKVAGNDLFDKLDTSRLNQHLKGIMPALTAKVFRTYNASITLDRLLQDTVGSNALEKSADYQRANKEVAILCNHQRTVSKSHSSQMEKLEAKMAEAEELIEEMKVDLDRARKGKTPLKDSDGKPKKNQSPEVLEKKIVQTELRVEKMKLEMKIKDDLKTVALGTSKINYLDPRISVAWCKRHEVPIEKIFNKSLLAKFAWAMDVDPEYRF